MIPKTQFTQNVTYSLFCVSALQISLGGSGIGRAYQGAHLKDHNEGKKIKKNFKKIKEKLMKCLFVFFVLSILE